MIYILGRYMQIKINIKSNLFNICKGTGENVGADTTLYVFEIKKGEYFLTLVLRVSK